MFEAGYEGEPPAATEKLASPGGGVHLNFCCLIPFLHFWPFLVFIGKFVVSIFDSCIINDRKDAKIPTYQRAMNTNKIFKKC